MKITERHKDILIGLLVVGLCICAVVFAARGDDGYEPPPPNMQGELQHLWAPVPVPVPSYPSEPVQHKKGKKRKERTRPPGESSGSSSFQFQQSTASAISPTPGLCVQGVAGQSIMGGASISNLHPLCSILLGAEVQRELNRKACKDVPCDGQLTVGQQLWAEEWATRVVKSDVKWFTLWMGYVPLLEKLR